MVTFLETSALVLHHIFGLLLILVVLIGRQPIEFWGLQIDISVSLNAIARGSWGRSPCSDPTSIDEYYRSWCRDNNRTPNDGTYSFGFA